MTIRILSHFAHATYQTALSQIPGVKFYHVIDENAEYFNPDVCPKKFWSDTDPLPSNIVPISAKDVDQDYFDLMLIHWHPFIQPFRTLWQKIPSIMTEHTWPYKNLKSESFQWRNIRHDNCDHTVFITPTSQKAWASENDPQASYIYHSIDVDNFPQKTDYTGDQIMTTTNEFISRDWACGFSLWANVLGVPMRPRFDDIALYGYGNSNIGAISKGSRSREEILGLLYNAGLYFNPSIMSPIPMSLLEAVAVGTPIVSTAYCEAGTIFKTGEHGTISNSVSELRAGIENVFKDPMSAIRMADNAKQVVKDIFAPSRFRKEWLDLFKQIKAKGKRR